MKARPIRSRASVLVLVAGLSVPAASCLQRRTARSLADSNDLESTPTADSRYYDPTPTQVLGAPAQAGGLILVDINRDGWKDIVISNGSISELGPLELYLSDQGSFPDQPSWTSSGTAHYAKLSAGDIDKDGWDDVVASVMGTRHGGVHVFYNRSGELQPPRPIAVGAPSFGNALGDANGDGYLDLGIATGNPEVVHEHGFTEVVPGPAYIYYNTGGSFWAPVARWQAADNAAQVAWDVTFYDVDSNGFLDLIYGAPGLPIYLADAHGAISNRAGWVSSYSLHYVGTMDCGTRLTGRDDPGALLPIVVATHFKTATDSPIPDMTVDRYNMFDSFGFDPSPGPGHVRTALPDWFHASSASLSVSLADVDHDDKLDLVTGGFFRGATAGTPVRIFLGEDGEQFEDDPAYHSDTRSLITAIAVADLNRDGVQRGSRSVTVTGKQRVFVLPRRTIERIVSVTTGDIIVPPKTYAYIPNGNWIAFGKGLDDQEVTITYEYTASPDIVVANAAGRPSAGNFVFLHK